MTVTQYLETLRNDEGVYPNKDVETLAEIIQAWQSLAESWRYEPTRSYAETIFNEITEWEVKGESA